MNYETRLINKKLIIFLIGLPLFLSLIAAWQVSRIPGLNPHLAWLLARSLLMPVAGAAEILGRLGLAASLGALALGLFSLLNIRRLGRTALESRARLLSGFQSGLKSLPWQVGSLGLLLALALSSVLMFELLVRGPDWLNLGRRADFFIVFLSVGFCLVSLYFSLKLIWHTFQNSRRLFEPDPECYLGRRVTEEEAPELWRLVRTVAGRIGAEPPDQLGTGLAGGFFVTQAPVRFSDSPEETIRGRTLYLPLGALAFMRRDEAEAVIGHELAHFVGEDTEYSRHFAPIYARAVNNLEALNQAAHAAGQAGPTGLTERPVRLLVEYFLASFHVAVNHWRREREIEADRLGALEVGNQAQARAMLKLSVLDPLVARAAAESWEAGGGTAETLLDRLRRLVREEGLADPAAHLDDVQPHPTDSHPPLRRRLDDLGVPLTDELLDEIRQTSPTTLLSDLGLEDENKAPDQAADLKVALEDQFARAARDNAESELEIFRIIAADGLERREYFESLRSTLAAFVCCLLIALGAAGAGFAKNNHWLLLGAGLAALGLSICIRNLFRRPKGPFLVLDADGFTVSGADSPIPWTSVAHFQIIVVSGSVTIIFHLAVDQAPPLIAKNPLAQYLNDKEGSRVVSSVMGLPRSVKLQDLAEEIDRHRQGGLARAELRRREQAAGEAAETSKSGDF